MTLMMNYFDPQYDYQFWRTTTMPDIYKVVFQGQKLVSTTRLWEKNAPLTASQLVPGET